MTTRRSRLQATTVMAAALWLAVAGSGCARSRPATIPVPVALNVPPPPPRVISTPPEPVAPTEATTVERAAPASRPVRATRTPSSRPDVRPVEARPEAVDPAPPPLPTAEPAPAPAGPLLRTPQTADENVAVRRTNEVLGRARELLKTIGPASLSTAARQQFDTAQRFIEQAEQAIVSRNYVLATYLADKAETLAKGLSR